MQNPQCVSELELNINSLPMQSTPVAQQSAGEPTFTAESEDVWAVWPYCWAIDLYAFARECFHSFHEKHQQWQLERYNRRAQAAFQRYYWQQWSREDEDQNLELRLV